MKTVLLEASQFLFRKMAIASNFEIAKLNKLFANSSIFLRVIVFAILPTYWKYLFCEILLSNKNARMTLKNDNIPVFYS